MEEKIFSEMNVKTETILKWLNEKPSKRGVECVVDSPYRTWIVWELREE